LPYTISCFFNCIFSFIFLLIEEEIIEKSEAKGDHVIKMVEEIKKAGAKVLRNNEW